MNINIDERMEDLVFGEITRLEEKRVMSENDIINVK